MDKIDELLLTFSYDPLSGVIVRKISKRKRSVGKPCGARESHGYLQIKFHGRLLMAHQIAWAIFYGYWPEFEIDHENLIKSDNRITNLRPATRRQNIANAPVRKDNALGIKGVSRMKNGRYRSRITESGKPVFLGLFDTAEEASNAYQRRHAELHGAYSRS